MPLVRCPDCGNSVSDAAEACPHCGYPMRAHYGLRTREDWFGRSPARNASQRRPTKSKTTALILALFLGGAGIHRFYLGRPVSGLLYLVFCWTFIPLGLAILEVLRLALMSDEDFAEKYG